MSEALDLASKESFILVAFTYGGGDAYFTDWTSDYTYLGKTYVSTPEMEVKLPVNDGMFSEQTCEVALPRSTDSADFTYRISTGQPHTPVACKVIEITRALSSSAAQNTNVLFDGELEIAKRNHRGRRDKILLKSLTIKSKLATISLGCPCNHTCDNRLGDAACKVNMATANRVVPGLTVDTIDGRELTILTNATVEAHPDRFFHRGYLKLNGLYIGIRDWRSSDPLVFSLVRQPPTYWAGATISAVAGCDGSIDVCRDRFSNEDNFNGRGIAMPAYHPSFEDAP